MPELDTHHKVLDFGRHAGELWTRVPISYLKWLANELQDSNPNKAMALAELERRGAGLGVGGTGNTH